VSGGIFFY